MTKTHILKKVLTIYGILNENFTHCKVLLRNDWNKKVKYLKVSLILFNIIRIMRHFANGLKKIKEFEKSIAELSVLITAEKFGAANLMIKKGLEYFQKRFSENISKYQGDHTYVKLLHDLVCKGYNLNQAFEISKIIIDREFALVQLSQILGDIYTPNFKF